jgi:hypothetical protein
MKHMKFWVALAVIIAVICSLIPVFLPVQASSYNLVKSASNPLVSSGISASNETVIYDSSAGLYKMWYVQTTNTDNTTHVVFIRSVESLPHFNQRPQSRKL